MAKFAIRPRSRWDKVYRAFMLCMLLLAAAAIFGLIKSTIFGPAPTAPAGVNPILEANRDPRKIPPW
jgi:hypothetical protein